MVSTSFITLLLPALAFAAPFTSPRSTSAGSVSFKNNCGYDVTFAMLNPCGSEDSGSISAGSSWAGSIYECSNGNTALKIYKAGYSKPMQFEYGLTNGNVWYDMSFIDCVSGGNDFSQCAGSAWSIAASDGSCPSYTCSGGSDCCIQGYCDPTASVASQQPVGACGTNQGLSPSSVDVSIDLC